MMSRIWEHKGAAWWLANKVANSITVLAIIAVLITEIESNQNSSDDDDETSRNTSIIISVIIYLFVLLIKGIKLLVVFIVANRVMNEKSNPAPAPGDIGI
jgi:hypothetical protein